MTYLLPEAEDAEFLPIKITASLIKENAGVGGNPLPSFIRLQGK